MIEENHTPSNDLNIRAVIVEALSGNERYRQLDLRVGVQRGIVHLGGKAPSLELWCEVEQCVSAVPGIRGVANRIQAPGAPDPTRTINLEFARLTRTEKNLHMQDKLGAP